MESQEKLLKELEKMVEKTRDEVEVTKQDSDTAPVSPFADVPDPTEVKLKNEIDK